MRKWQTWKDALKKDRLTKKWTAERANLAGIGKVCKFSRLRYLKKSEGCGIINGKIAKGCVLS